MKSRIELLGVTIDPLTMSETVKKVDEEYIQKHIPLHLMGVNADKINLCQIDQRLMKIVNECGIINADGASVILASKYLGIDIPERVAGIDLMQELLKLCQHKGYSVYFLGSREEVLQQMILNFNVDYPNLVVSGSRDGYFSDRELPAITENIRLVAPDIVFVGITSPKKEYIVEEFLNSGVNSVFMGVGGSFDVLSGLIPRAPLWMQKVNLEWLFRVIYEPKRLFKRYFVGNFSFISRIIKEKRKRARN